jgi:hypothetical protein
VPADQVPGELGEVRTLEQNGRQQVQPVGVVDPRDQFGQRDRVEPGLQQVVVQVNLGGVDQKEGRGQVAQPALHARAQPLRVRTGRRFARRRGLGGRRVRDR